MISILNTTSTLFITILLGILCGKFKIFKPGHDRILINYVFYIALPLNLFLACYHATSHVFNDLYLLTYVTSMLLSITISYFISQLVFKQNNAESILTTLAATQVDGAYFTIPLFLVIFNSDSLAVSLILIQNTAFFTLSLILLQINHEKRQSTNHFLIFAIKRLLHVLFYNPIITLSLLGFAIGFLHIGIPIDIFHAIKFIGSSAPAVALFSLGLTCAFCMKNLTHKDKIYPLAMLGFIKLLFAPLISLIIGKLLHLEHDLLLAVILLTASPAATHTYIVARKYDTDIEIATFNVALTTVLSFFSVNLWLYWLT